MSSFGGWKARDGSRGEFKQLGVEGREAVGTGEVRSRKVPTQSVIAAEINAI